MRQIASLAITIFLALGPLLGACVPAATPTPAPMPTKVASVATSAAETPAPVAPTLAPLAEKPRYGGVLKVLQRADITHSDLHQGYTYLDLQPLAPVYSLLLKTDPTDTTKLIPDLAQRWEVNADGKIYTFYLRQGVKWHDGTTFTSADVKASFERQVWPPKGFVSQRLIRFKPVEKIETPDAHTVKFYLKQPQASFPSVLSVPWNVIFPKALLDEKGDMKKDIMGTGPFRLKQYLRGVQFVVEKNPDYFMPGRPYLDRIERYIIPDLAAGKGAFITGQVDLLQAIVPYKLFELEEWKKQRPDTIVQRSPSYTLFSFIPNNNLKPWSDIRVRRATMLALDKDALVKMHYPGLDVRGGFMYPGFWAIPTDELVKLPGWRKQTAEDLAEARRLLAEAGYPGGFTARHLERSLREYENQAVTFKDQLAKIGINLELDIRESGPYLAIRITPNFETMGEAIISVEIDDPDILLTAFLTGSPANYAQYSNSRVDELYRQQSQTLDTSKRKELANQIERQLIADLPVMPWTWRDNYAIRAAQVRNFPFLGIFLGYSMEDVWLAR